MNLDELKTSLWDAAKLLRGKINATGYKEYIFPLVFFKRISDVHLEERRKALEISDGDEEFAAAKENYTFTIPEGCLWEDVREKQENVGQALVTAWTRIEQANPSKVVGDHLVEGLSGIFGKRDHWTNKNILPDQTLTALIERFSTIDLSIASCPADEMGQAYEYLVGKFADDAGNTAQEFYTNRTVVELMAEILEPRAGESIYDPTCGTGGMLISCIARCKRHEENWREIKAFGQEQNALTSSVARMNLFLHGVEEFRIINDDTLLRPGFLDAGKLKTFDVVLANPPYSIKQWNRALFAKDDYGRNFLGTPPQGRADYAFIQHILKSMDPKTGRCAILLPHGVLFREEEKEIRKCLIETDLLECVIGLGPNLFYNSPMEACVLICRSQKDAAAKNHVLFINAVNEVTRKNAESKLEPQHIERILAAYRKRENDGAFAYDAGRQELEARDCNLNISLYAHQSAISLESESGETLEEALVDFELSADETNKELDHLSHAVNDEPYAESSFRPPRPDVSIPARANARRVKLSDVADEVRGTWQGDAKDVPIVGLEHLEPDEIWLRHWDVNPDENTFTKAFRKGQMLFGRRRAYQKKLSVAPCDGICSGDITVIAAKPDQILPELLPFYLRSEKFFDYAMMGSGGSLSPRVKWQHLADYEFDLPDLPRQKELAELLWAANDLKEKYKQMIVASDEMLKAKYRNALSFGELKQLCELSEISSGGTPDRKTASFWSGGDINWVKTTELKNNVISDTEEKITELGMKSSSAKLMPPGTILVAMYGQGKTRGMTGYLGCEATTNQACACIIPHEDVNSIFLWNSLMLSYKELRNLAKEGSQANLNLNIIGKFKIRVPSVRTQEELVALFKKTETVRAGLERTIAEVDAVIKGLING